MEITKLTVRNYKSFGTSENGNEDEIRRFNKINMIYGYNSSGKSNLLKFIQLVFQPKTSGSGIIVEGIRESIEGESAFWRGPITDSAFLFHKNNRNKPIEFEIFLRVENDEIIESGFSEIKALKKYFSPSHSYSTFYFEGGIRKVDDFDTAEMYMTNVSLNNRRIYSVDGTGRGVFFEEGPDNNALEGDSIAFGNLLSLFTNATLFLDNNRYLSQEKVNSGTFDLTAKEFKNWLYSTYLDSRRFKIFEDLNAFIKKYKIAYKLDSENAAFHDVERNSPLGNFSPGFSLMSNGNIEVMFKVGNERYPLSSFGTGIQQLLFILASLFVTNSKVILIEELELNLSPRYQKEFFKILWALITDGRIDQVFFTTHSSYFDHRNDFSVYEVSVDKRGATKVNKVTKTQKNVFFKRIDV